MSQAPAAREDRVSAGAVLAGAREELNLTIPEVARHLKLTPAQVEALEAGAYERLPGRVFVRGFLRNYAKLLGIDPQPLLRSIDYEIPRPEVVEEMRLEQEVVMPQAERSRWPLYTALTAVIVVGALAVYEFGFNDTPREARAPAGPAASAPAAPGAAPSATPASPAAPASPVATVPATTTTAAAPAPAEKTDKAVAAAPPAAEAVPSLARSTSPGEPAGLPVAASNGSPAPTLAPGEKELRLVFSEESWVEIRDGRNKVIFSKLNAPGGEQRIAGKPPFKLVIGNAKGVRLTYDEKPVDLAPHTGVTVARLTLE